MKVIKTENAGIQIDCDISKLTEQDYEDINELYLDNLLITFINQPFETLPFAKLIHKMGTFANWNQMLWKQDGSNLSKSGFVDPFAFETDSLTPDPDNSYPVQRVTGKKTEKGLPTGIFGNGELDWHSNMNGEMDRARGVALQGAWHCEGTHTAFMDTVKAYDDMSDELKARCEGVIGNYEYAPENWAKGVPTPQLHMMKGFGLTDSKYTMPLVHEGFNGKKGLYFHYHNNCKFEDKELKQLLMEHCFQSKYIYEHEWHPGDIVISDQVLTLHKRVEWDPEIIAKRVLHRVTFHYDNMIDDYFDKYTKIKETNTLEY
jgi:alpha-ketoglutarate-dependent taurine dioxygenase